MLVVLRTTRVVCSQTAVQTDDRVRWVCLSVCLSASNWQTEVSLWWLPQVLLGNEGRAAPIGWEQSSLIHRLVQSDFISLPEKSLHKSLYSLSLLSENISLYSKLPTFYFELESPLQHLCFGIHCLREVIDECWRRVGG